MGTNFYAYRMLSRAEKDGFKDLIEMGRLDDVVDRIEDMDHNKIHIGKNSFGWKFLFNHNHRKYYELSRESIDGFLRRDDIALFNEYDEEVSVDGFWKMVDACQHEMDDTENTKKNRNAVIDDFYENGLRFSRSTEFS